MCLGSPDDSRPTPGDESIRRHVDNQHQNPQTYLEPAREAQRIDQRQGVILNKAIRVSDSATHLTKAVLERGEGTDPTTELDPGPPQSTRNMDPRDSRPVEYHHSAKTHEEDEPEV